MVVLRGIFQAKAEVLTIGCKDNMFSIKVTLSGDDLQLAMTCSHSVKNIGHRPLVKNSVKNIQLYLHSKHKTLSSTAQREKLLQNIGSVLSHGADDVDEDN